jgi:dTDP-4-amino-4,6-dideoxygalactose transaminase
LQAALKAAGIPSMVYYPKPMHSQTAFNNAQCAMHNAQLGCDQYMANQLSNTVLSLPMHPYLESSDIERISSVLIASL